MTIPQAIRPAPISARTDLDGVPFFELRRTQDIVWAEEVAQIILYLGGFGSGKSALLAHLMMRSDPTIRHLLASNTYRQIHEGIIPDLEEHWLAAGVEYCYGQVKPPRHFRDYWIENRIKVPSRGVRAPNTLIFITGQHFVVSGLEGDSYKRLKGPSYGHIFVDEIPELRSSSPLDFLLPRMRCGHAATCEHHHCAYFFGNPPPPYDPHWIRDWHKRMSAMNDRARAKGKPQLYLFVSASTRENIAAVGEGYIDLVRAAIPEGAAEAWIDGKLSEFKSGTTTYRNWSEANKIPVAYDPLRPVHVAMDFNVDPCCATLGHELRDSEVPKEYRGKRLEHLGTFGEIRITGGCDVYQLALYLVRGERGTWPENFRGLQNHGSQIIVYGDPSGYQRRVESRDNRSAWSGVLDILNQNCAHVHLDVPRSAPGEHDSVFLFNLKMHADNGDRSYFVDPTFCPWLIADFEKVIPQKDGMKLIAKNDISITHLSDAERYKAYQRCSAARGGRAMSLRDLRGLASAREREPEDDTSLEGGYPESRDLIEPRTRTRTLQRRGGRL